MKVLVLLVAGVMAAIGAVAVVTPDHLLAAMRVVASPVGLYGIGALRVCMGLVLIWAAWSSRAPTALRAFGVLFVVAGLATPLFGVERTQAVMNYAATHGGLLLRGAGTVLLAFGAFLAFTVTPRRPA